MDPDQELSDWVHIVCLNLSYICNSDINRCQFSGNYLTSAHGECFSRKWAEIDLPGF